MSDNEEDESLRRGNTSPKSPSSRRPGSRSSKVSDDAAKLSPKSQLRSPEPEKNYERLRITVSSNLTSPVDHDKRGSDAIKSFETDSPQNYLKNSENEINVHRSNSRNEYNNLHFNSAPEQAPYNVNKRGSYNGFRNVPNDIIGKEDRNTILNTYVNNQVEIYKIINERANFMHNGSFSNINNFINRVNNITSLNGAKHPNNMNHLLSPRLLPHKDPLSGYHPLTPGMYNSNATTSHHPSPSVFTNTNLSTSMMTLSPPHTLSPHNRSNNMSLSSLSASPQDEGGGDDDGDEADDENDALYRNTGSFTRKHRKFNDIYSSPSNFSKSLFSGQTSPPLTPLNNNHIIPNKKYTNFDISRMNLSNRCAQENDPRLPIPALFSSSVSPPTDSLSMINHSQNLQNFPSKKGSEMHKIRIKDTHETAESMCSTYKTSSRFKEENSSESKHMVPDTTVNTDGSSQYSDVASHSSFNYHHQGGHTSSEINAATEKFITQQLSATPPELRLKQTTTGSHSEKSTDSDDGKANDSKRTDSQTSRNLNDQKKHQHPSDSSNDLVTLLPKVDSWTTVSRQLDDLPNTGDATSTHRLGVFAKNLVPKGTRYGPFLGKWVSLVSDPTFAWEVSTKDLLLLGY